jgi:hypothetical protein
MGFYYGATRPRLSSEDVGPVITPREYITLLDRAMRMVYLSPLHASDTSCQGRYRPEPPGDAIEGLSRQVQRHPADATIHRMLAIAHLRAGHCRLAIRHLEIAINILCRKISRGSLESSLSARVELGLLLPVIVPLCLRLGRRVTARRLVGELLRAL